MAGKTVATLREDLLDPSFPRNSFCQKGQNIYDSKLPSWGISIPHLKAVAALYAEDNGFDYKDIPLDESVEMTLAFFVIGLSREATFAGKMDFMRAYCPAVDSWVITDSCPQYIKKPAAEAYLPYCREFVSSDDPFLCRFGYVYALKYYKEKDIMPFLKLIKDDERKPVVTAEGWLLATLAIAHFEEVHGFLANPFVNPVLRRIAISKCCDSYRIGPQEKDTLRKLRRP